MKTLLLVIFSVILGFTITGCKDDCSETPEPVAPYEQEIYKFQVVDMGQIDKGYCGLVIVAYLDSLSTTTTNFKAIDLPFVLSVNRTDYYTGRFRILPTVYSCKNGLVDPIPNQPAPTIYPHLVEILEWEQK